MVGNFLEVLNLNRLFLKHNWFSCNCGRFSMFIGSGCQDIPLASNHVSLEVDTWVHNTLQHNLLMLRNVVRNIT